MHLDEKRRNTSHGSTIGEVLTFTGFALLETGSFFARPSLTSLSPQQDVIVLAGQVAVALVAAITLTFGPLSYRRTASGTADGVASHPPQWYRWGRLFATVSACAWAVGQLVVHTIPEWLGLFSAYLVSTTCGIGLGGCCLAWMCTFARLTNPKHGPYLLLGSLAVSRGIIMALRMLDNEAAWLYAGFILIDASIVLLLILFWSPTGSFAQQAKGVPASSLNLLQQERYAPVLLGTAFCALLFGLITQIHNNTQVPTLVSDLVSSPVIIILLLALMFYIHQAHKTLRFENAFLVAVPVIAAVMAGAAIMHTGVTSVTDITVKVLYTVCLAMLYVVLLHRTCTSGTWLRPIVLAMLAVWGCTLAGSAIGLALLMTTGLDSNVVAAVLLAAMWLCTLISVVLPRAGLHKETSSTPDQSPTVVYVDRTAEQVRSFAQNAGLSNREQQIVLLFVQGRSASRIAAELTLSENTVKTHLQNVYGKVGLHSKQELIDRIADQPMPQALEASSTPQANLDC